MFLIAYYRKKTINHLVMQITEVSIHTTHCLIKQIIFEVVISGEFQINKLRLKGPSKCIHFRQYTLMPRCCR